MTSDLRTCLIGSVGFVYVPHTDTLHVRIYDRTAGWKGSGRPLERERRTERRRAIRSAA